MKLWIVGALLLAGCSTAGGRVAAYCNPVSLLIGGIVDDAIPYSEDAEGHANRRPSPDLVKHCRRAIDEVRE